MADETRITQAVVQVDVTEADNPIRVTQSVVQVDVKYSADLPIRMTQTVVMVDVKEPYRGAAATFGPQLQVM